jgi:hypothetical protein
MRGEPTGRAWSTVYRWWHKPSVRRRAHRSMASGRSGALKLTGGGAIERGEDGELGSGLTEARAAAWRPSDGGVEPEAAALGGSVARAWREEKRG